MAVLTAPKPAVRDWWGDQAPAGAILDPDVAAGAGYTAAGWPLSTQPPARQFWNWVLNYCMQGIRYHCQNGLPDWDANEVYQLGACVLAPPSSPAQPSIFPPKSVIQSVINNNTANPNVETSFVAPTHWAVFNNTLSINWWWYNYVQATYQKIGATPANRSYVSIFPNVMIQTGVDTLSSTGAVITFPQRFGATPMAVVASGVAQAGNGTVSTGNWSPTQFQLYGNTAGELAAWIAFGLTISGGNGYVAP